MYTQTEERRATDHRVKQTKLIPFDTFETYWLKRRTEPSEFVLRWEDYIKDVKVGAAYHNGEWLIQQASGITCEDIDATSTITSVQRCMTSDAGESHHQVQHQNAYLHAGNVERMAAKHEHKLGVSMLADVPSIRQAQVLYPEGCPSAPALLHCPSKPA